MKIQEILRQYQRASGQMINVEKSSLFFSKNTTLEEKEGIQSLLGQMQVVTQGKYLGLPMIVGRSKNQIFGYIRDKVIGRLKSWKGNLLSQAGKEVLLKSVVTAMPAYTMSCFRLSKSLCKDLAKEMAKFWWGSNKDKQKLHWIKWEKLSEVKGKGGLGFRDFQHFNTALLAKQYWRLLTNPDLLVSRVLNQKYLKNSNWLQTEPPQNASWIWKSLTSARTLLENGMRKRIGDGRSTRIWEDKWILQNRDGKIRTKRPPSCHVEMVSELIQHKRWNSELIKGIFHKEDWELILAIPISLCGHQDQLMWNFSSTGLYTVKTGYVQAKLSQEPHETIKEQEGEASWTAQSTTIWNFLWKLNVKHKIKHFLWKCLQQILPVDELIHRRTGKGDPVCKRCGAEMETIEHALLLCSKSELIWKTSPLQWDGIKNARFNFRKWWGQIQEASERDRGMEHVELTANLLWQIWKDRNTWLFNNERKDFHQVAQRALEDWNEFELAQKEKRKESTGETSQQQLPTSWTPPSQGTVKLNTDAAIHSKKDRVGIGIIARDWQGKLLNVWASNESRKGEAASEEAYAIRLALKKAQEEGS